MVLINKKMIFFFGDVEKKNVKFYKIIVVFNFFVL